MNKKKRKYSKGGFVESGELGIDYTTGKVVRSFDNSKKHNKNEPITNYVDFENADYDFIIPAGVRDQYIKAQLGSSPHDIARLKSIKATAQYKSSKERDGEKMKTGSFIKGLGDTFQNIGAMAVGNAASIVGLENVEDEWYSKNKMGNTFKDVTDVTQQINKQAAPIVADAFLPGAGMALRGVQAGVGQFNPESTASESSQEISANIGQLGNMAGVMMGGMGSPNASGVTPTFGNGGRIDEEYLGSLDFMNNMHRLGVHDTRYHMRHNDFYNRRRVEKGKGNPLSVAREGAEWGLFDLREKLKEERKGQKHGDGGFYDMMKNRMAEGGYTTRQRAVVSKYADGGFGPISYGPFNSGNTAPGLGGYDAFNHARETWGSSGLAAYYDNPNTLGSVQYVPAGGSQNNNPFDTSRPAFRTPTKPSGGYELANYKFYRRGLDPGDKFSGINPTGNTRSANEYSDTEINPLSDKPGDWRDTRSVPFMMGSALLSSFPAALHLATEKKPEYMPYPEVSPQQVDFSAARRESRLGANSMMNQARRTTSNASEYLAGANMANTGHRRFVDKSVQDEQNRNAELRQAADTMNTEQRTRALEAHQQDMARYKDYKYAALGNIAENVTGAMADYRFQNNEDAQFLALMDFYGDSPQYERAATTYNNRRGIYRQPSPKDKREANRLRARSRTAKRLRRKNK